MHVAYNCNEEDLDWAGMSCTEDEPCPIYLELTSAASNGKKIVAAGNLHSESATLSSVLLLSDDSGATWKEPAARIRGGALEQVQFFNPQTGWAAGETLYPLPRDPFLLLTTDGGASWRQTAVGEDGAPGSIQRFWFDSTRHGELIVDAGKSSEGGRYWSFESETGGDTWTLHGKSDQLPALRDAPRSAEDTGWRARPSEDGKAFQIEQRDGDQWKTAASFLVEAAICRSQAAVLKEPEPAAGALPVPAATPATTPTAARPKRP